MKEENQFPGWVEKIIRRLCGPYWAEGIQGDLYQNFRQRLSRIGRTRAKLWLYLELLGLTRFLFYKKEKSKRSNIMIGEYFKVGFRVLLRSKVYSMVNLFGLGAGMACALLIYLWVQDEVSYDRFHENGDELFRVEFDRGGPFKNPTGPGELAPSIQAQLPEVVRVSRYWKSRTPLILQRGQDVFHESNSAAVDPDFFNMFSFKFVDGDPERALSDPFSIVLSETLAKKYFGDANPIGQTIKLNNKHLMTVSAIMEEMPTNSSMRFDIALSMEFLKVLDWYTASWSSVWLQTYVQVPQNVDKGALGSKILESILRGTHNRWDKERVNALILKPVPEMRLKAYVYTSTGFQQKTLQSIYTFSGLGALILLIACINFMNLATARSAKRAKEIGMRKVVGAVKKNIRTQFLGEALMQTLIALVLALVLVLLLLGPFNELSGKSVELSALLTVPFIAGVVAITLLVALVAGSYPAFYLSSFLPIRVLKGQLSAGMKSGSLRKVLVVIQFGLSIFLIIGTLVIYNQMNYIQSKELGYDKDHVLYLPLVHDDTKSAFQSLKTRWLALPEVDQVSASQVNPSQIGWSSSAEWEGKNPEDYEDIYHNRVEMDYLKTMGIEILDGRDYSKDFLADDAEDGQGGFIVNETMAKKMTNDGNALGMVLKMAGNQGPVVGIMKDFHFSSLRSGIRPIAIMQLEARKRFALIKINSADIGGTISALEDTWTSVLPDYPFEIHFFDEDFERMYLNESRLGKLLGTFSLLAIIIASLGLFGLASFTAEERAREVAIRKVLGATYVRVTYLLCRDFMLLVVLANIIAWPLGKWIMGNWLDSFAYRIDFGVSIFVTAGVLAIAIALLTIIFQTSKAAMANPVVALKHE